MITAAFDLAIWTVLIFAIGMYKPQWPLFFLKNPSRFMIVIITTVLFMLVATLYGEGVKEEKEKAAQEIAPTAAPAATQQSTVPVPVPAPEVSKPAEKPAP
jgi:hypothetical protein